MPEHAEGAETVDPMSSEESLEKEEEFRNHTQKSLSDIQLQISKIREDIQYAVVPKFLEISSETNDLVELAIELWRMEQRIRRVSPALSESQKESLNNSLQKLKRFLDKNDIEIVDHTDQKYDSGQNLEILAVEKDSAVPEATIKETKEPTILYRGQVIHVGKVIVASKDED